MFALRSLPHLPGVTVSDCHRQARGRGPGGHYQPGQRDVFFARQVKLEMFCDDAICEELVETIRINAHTGISGDGIIMVADLPHVVSLRTGERQISAT